MPQLLGAKLRHLRHQHNLTQQAVARYLGLSSHSHIAKLETDQTTASLSIVVRIASLYGVSTDYLLRDTIAVGEIEASELRVGELEQLIPGELGARLRDRRLQQGMPQQELRKGAGLASRANISHIEAGRKLPSLDSVVLLADALGIPTDQLLRSPQ